MNDYRLSLRGVLFSSMVIHHPVRNLFCLCPTGVITYNISTNNTELNDNLEDDRIQSLNATLLHFESEHYISL